MKEEYLAQLPFWPQLSEKQKAFAADSAVLRHYAKGELIQSHTCLGLVYIVEGAVRAYLLSEEGREVTLFLLREGECCVLSASCVLNQITFDTHLIAQEACNLLVIPSGAFSRLTEENIYVKCFSYETAALRFSAVVEAMNRILFEKFDRRLAGFLLREYERTKKRELHMTHEEIAVQISSAREVVARTLKRFAQENLVEIRRGLLVLKDIDGLRNL